MSDFTPKTRLEKILCGVVTTAKTRLEKAVKYAVDHAGGGASDAPLEATGTVTINPETGKQTVATDKTAAELYAAVYAGRAVRMTLSLNGGTVTRTVWVDAQEAGGALYDFAFTTVSEEGGLLGFLAAGLSADGTVIFTQQ